MSEQVESLLTDQQVQALSYGQYADIFSVLGMHAHPSGKGLLVRVMLPGAVAVDVIASKDNRRVASLTRIGNNDCFEGKMGRRKNPFAYRLRVTYDSAEGTTTVEQEDPYRFASALTPEDLYLFCEGKQERGYQWMGAQPRTMHSGNGDKVEGVLFVLWAPNCSRVSVVGEFNHWDGRRHVMRKHPAAGIWEIFIPGVGASQSYKYEMLDANGKLLPLKADPYAFAMQHPPETASLTMAANTYQWQDQQWMDARAQSANPYHGAVSTYEVHLGSWRRSAERGGGYLNYRELAEQLIPYVIEMGFTHIQLMPVSEYPFDGSWGYQPVGLYAPTSRFGSPDDFRFFIDSCHQSDIGILLDWVPGHFPTDEYGTGKFDGSCLYEHEDLRKGFHPDWNTLIYNYGRAEVVSYLLSNAMYWLDEFHIDGLRVDAVASMLYLDYGREEGQWIPNKDGGRENYEAIEFLRQVNSRAYFNYPGVMIIAEESTAWPGVSRPIDQGGLGFGFKWNMGWMNDTLKYMERDPIHRQYHHNEMTFGLVYGFSENFVLPLSHDEVVHGKRSLLEKMPGDDWQKFANLRAYLGFMWSHPGKKLLFMGGEFAQRDEWNHDISLDWHLLEHDSHAGIQRLVKDLNQYYRNTPALHQLDCDASGFEWIDSQNNEQSILAYLRRGHVTDAGAPLVVVIVNLTPQTYHDYAVGVPEAGFYRECLNTDAQSYGGSNKGNNGGVTAVREPWQGQPCKLSLTIPPLATVIFEYQPH